MALKEPPWAKNNPNYRGAFSKDPEGQPLGRGGGWFRTGQGPAGNETTGGSPGRHRGNTVDGKPRRGMFGQIVPEPGSKKGKSGKSGGGGGRTVGNTGLTREQLNHPFGGGKGKGGGKK
jgi:hypothetical protein